MLRRGFVIAVPAFLLALFGRQPSAAALPRKATGRFVTLTEQYEEVLGDLTSRAPLTTEVRTRETTIDFACVCAISVYEPGIRIDFIGGSHSKHKGIDHAALIAQWRAFHGAG